ncbi:MAG: fructose-bisphosphatase class III, partial [Lachnospiraceae bacterium]|nr:fructose-bisphosphatase class III [Lachnospiraceae bacterium]
MAKTSLPSQDLSKRYLERLSDLYPTITAASTEVINLSAILQLPKGTEHFLTDVHGENEAFSHVLRNASGTVRHKIDDIFGNSLSQVDKRELATLIYYPEEKMHLVFRDLESPEDWYRVMLC